jgi:hypothetical protein
VPRLLGGSAGKILFNQPFDVSQRFLPVLVQFGACSLTDAFLGCALVDLQRGLILLEDTKNDEDRIVPLPGKLHAMLAKAAHREGRVFDTTNIC